MTLSRTFFTGMICSESVVTADISRKLKDDFSLVYLASIECIFKSQKSNGFRLESTNTQKIEHFISLFTVMCIALVWLTILSVDYSRNKSRSHLKIRDAKRNRKGTPVRLLSYFNLGLTIFNLYYYNTVSFTLKFDFVLYDV